MPPAATPREIEAVSFLPKAAKGVLQDLE